MTLFSRVGDALARFLQKPSSTSPNVATCQPDKLIKAIRKGDVLLVEGVSRISTAIKYLTQSTWSHATLCVEDGSHLSNPTANDILLLEADVLEGVRIVTLEQYVNQHTRICRAIGLTEEELQQAIEYAKSRLGHQYDTKNVFDLARYLIQTPPVPVGWRRRMISLGSGDPTRAICSSLIAQTFQSIRYPILPDVTVISAASKRSQKEVMQIRHHSLFVPRDFDISPYFSIVKPSLTDDFDPHIIHWAD